MASPKPEASTFEKICLTIFISGMIKFAILIISSSFTVLPLSDDKWLKATSALKFGLSPKAATKHKNCSKLILPWICLVLNIPESSSVFRSLINLGSELISFFEETVSFIF